MGLRTILCPSEGITARNCSETSLALATYWDCEFLFALGDCSRFSKLPHTFHKLDSYPFSKPHQNLWKGWQGSWGFITVGHRTTGKVWHHWFTAPLQISSKFLPSMGHAFLLQHEPVTFVLLIMVLSFFLSLTMLATLTLQKMKWNTTQGPNDLNMRLHISSWNSDDLIKLWRKGRQKYSLLCLVGYMYYLWCRMNDWLPWILICEANKDTLPPYMQCYRKVASSCLWFEESWIMAHFVCLSCSRKVNRQSCFNNKDLQSSVGQIPLYLTVQYQSYICPVFAD